MQSERCVYDFLWQIVLQQEGGGRRLEPGEAARCMSSITITSCSDQNRASAQPRSLKPLFVFKRCPST